MKANPVNSVLEGKHMFSGGKSCWHVLVYKLQVTVTDELMLVQDLGIYGGGGGCVIVVILWATYCTYILFISNKST